MYFTLEGTVYCKPVLVFLPLTDSDIKPEMECFKICVGNLCVSRAMGFSHSGGQCAWKLSNMIYVLKSRIPPNKALLCLLYLNEEKLKDGMTTELFFSIFCSLKNLIWKKRRIWQSYRRVSFLHFQIITTAIAIRRRIRIRITCLRTPKNS